MSDANDKHRIQHRWHYYADILASLAEGIDPETGTKLNDSLLDKPSVIRALYAGAAALRNSSKSDSAVNPPVNAGAKWTAEDDAILIEAYNNSEPIDVLAVDFGRSEVAIQMRLEKLLATVEDEKKRIAMQNTKLIKHREVNRWTKD